MRRGGGLSDSRRLATPGNKQGRSHGWGGQGQLTTVRPYAKSPLCGGSLAVSEMYGHGMPPMSCP